MDLLNAFLDLLAGDVYDIIVPDLTGSTVKYNGEWYNEKEGDSEYNAKLGRALECSFRICSVKFHRSGISFVSNSVWLILYQRGLFKWKPEIGRKRL